MPNSISSTAINALIIIAMIATGVMFFRMVYVLLTKAYSKRDDIVLNINKRFSSKGDMSYKERQLSQMGVMYRMKNYNFTPANYFVLRIIAGITGALVLFVFGTLLVKRPFIAIPIGFAVGFFGVPWYFSHENKDDNEKMIMDIYNTYANIKIQMSAGIYIREVLEYTYKMVTHERYKEALAELILNFSDKTISSMDAVAIFQNRFSSIEIDKLSALIGSFMQYGINSEHAEDIMVEIQGLIQAETIKAEHDIEAKAGAINFAFFGIIIAMVVFVIFSSFNMGGIMG